MQSLSQYGNKAARREDAPPAEVVALAASLGALQAFAQILSTLPADFPAPILLMQHLSRPPSLLPRLLAGVTRLAVAEARDGETMAAGRVHVAPPGRHLLVRPDRTLALSDEEPVWFARPSADRLFQSVAEAFGERAVAVILTGRGFDGVEGIRAVRRAGGMTIAQSAKTCRAPEMPVHAAETGCVDMVLPLHQIGPMLQILAPPPPLQTRHKAAAPPFAAGPLTCSADSLPCREWRGSVGSTLDICRE